MVVYIHIPFCRNICSYCDFTKIIYSPKKCDNYLNVLNSEILTRYNNEIINSIYIGGGTPSILSYEERTKLFNTINVFKKNEEIEFTFECNVEDINVELLEFLVSHGVNRLSVGIQSFLSKNIAIMNRKHTREQAIENILIAKKYFKNINIDMIYGINEDLTCINEDLDILLNLDFTHISYYSLIIESNTKLHIINHKYIDEDIEFNIYTNIKNRLINNGYNNYEISNYCKEGFESKHNLTYWNNDEYYGFGLGSHSYLGDYRIINTKSINKYLKKDYIFEMEFVDKKNSMINEIMLGFRKLAGINIKNFYIKYSISIYDAFDFNDLIKTGYIIDDGEYLYINPKYIYISNEILTKLI